MLIASSWYVWAQVALVALLKVPESPLTPQLSHNVDGGATAPDLSLGIIGDYLSFLSMFRRSWL